jgi:hypothetical protein
MNRPAVVETAVTTVPQDIHWVAMCALAAYAKVRKR